MRILFFEPDITGHRQEYLTHLIHFVQSSHSSNDFIFIVHPNFQSPPLTGSSITIEALRLPPHRRGSYAYHGLAGAMQHSIRLYRLAGQFAKKHHANHVCFLNFNEIQFALGYYRPPFSISGILFKPFVRQQITSSKDHWIRRRKYLQTWQVLRNKRITHLFILNDSPSVNTLNQVFNSQVFKLLPDPIPELNPEPNYDVRAQFGIEPNRKIYLHIGSLLKRKGTLAILDAIKLLADKELAQFTLLVAGYAEPDMDAEIQRRLPDHQNPDHPSAPASVVYRNEYVSPAVFKSLIDAGDLILIPYRYTESSSGIMGHAIAAGKPMLAVQEGLVGEMIAQYGSGIFIETCNPENIANGLKQFQNQPVDGKYSEIFVKDHRPEHFASTLIDSIAR